MREVLSAIINVPYPRKTLEGQYMAGFEKAFENTRDFCLSGFKVQSETDTAFNETMSIMNDVEAFSNILQSMREARNGQLLSLEVAFADIL